MLRRNDSANAHEPMTNPDPDMPKTSARFPRALPTSRGAAAAPARWFVGISRHGVLAAERVTQRPTSRNSFRQAISLLSGSMFIGLGVSLFVHGKLGVPAYDVMLSALRDRLNITIGQAGWVFTGFLFIVATLFGQRPKLSGLIFVFANGIAIDAWMRLIRDPETLPLQMLFVLLGTLAIAAGVALVIHAGLTGGALELLMQAAEEHGIDPFKFRRTAEISIVVVGVLLGGDLGLATVFFVFTMSPALKTGQQALADHRVGRELRLSEPV